MNPKKNRRSSANHSSDLGSTNAFGLTATDILSAVAVADSCNIHGHSDLRGDHGLSVSTLAQMTIGDAPHGVRGLWGNAGSKTEEALTGSLLKYADYFAPDHHWALVSLDVTQGLLRWECVTQDLPDVVDLFSRYTLLREPLVPDFHAPTIRNFGAATRRQKLNGRTPRPWRQPVIRRLNTRAQHVSTLLFPGEAPVRWCAADDPIISRECAFIDLPPTAATGSHFEFSADLSDHDQFPSSRRRKIESGGPRIPGTPLTPQMRHHGITGTHTRHTTADTNNDIKGGTNDAGGNVIGMANYLAALRISRTEQSGDETGKGMRR